MRHLTEWRTKAGQRRLKKISSLQRPNLTLSMNFIF